jgi:hypothetical protein
MMEEAGGKRWWRPMNQHLTEEALLLNPSWWRRRTAVEAEINARLREIIAGSTETITENC